MTNSDSVAGASVRTELKDLEKQSADGSIDAWISMTEIFAGINRDPKTLTSLLDKIEDMKGELNWNMGVLQGYYDRCNKIRNMVEKRLADMAEGAK